MFSLRSLTSRYTFTSGKIGVIVIAVFVTAYLYVWPVAAGSNTYIESFRDKNTSRSTNNFNIPPIAPPLPIPAGNVVNVSTVEQLQNAMVNLTSNINAIWNKQRPARCSRL